MTKGPIPNISARQTATPSRIALLLGFFAIYVVWGSTYLAIRYAVESIPPLLVAGLRHSVAGLVLLGWAWTRGYRPAAREWKASLVLGTLYFVIGHGSLHWAETIVPSGLAALLVATEPIWIALMVATISREEPLTAKTVLGLLIGIASVALLVRDEAGSGYRMIVGSIAILVGAASWALGVIYSRTDKLPRDPVARAGTAAVCGAAILLLSAGLTGELAHVHPGAFTARSVAGLLYLIVFGSIIAFTAYTWLLDHCSATLVSTHTYVNPIIAVLLGWILAGEVLSRRVLLAGLLTLFAVFLISRGTGRREAVEISEAEAA